MPLFLFGKPNLILLAPFLTWLLHGLPLLSFSLPLLLSSAKPIPFAPTNPFKVCVYYLQPDFLFLKPLALSKTDFD